jgi:hypothetical protein
MNAPKLIPFLWGLSYKYTFQNRPYTSFTLTKSQNEGNNSELETTWDAERRADHQLKKQRPLLSKLISGKGMHMADE